MDIVHATERLILDADGRVHLRDVGGDEVRIGRMVGGDFAFAPGTLRPVLHDTEVEEVERAWLDHCADLVDVAAEQAEWESGYRSDRGVRAAG
jgi:hypothetical protein